MRADTFEGISSVARRRAGIVLTPDKTYMLETRLGPVLQRAKLDTLDALAGQLRRPGQDELER